MDPDVTIQANHVERDPSRILTTPSMTGESAVDPLLDVKCEVCDPSLGSRERYPVAVVMGDYEGIGDEEIVSSSPVIEEINRCN